MSKQGKRKRVGVLYSTDPDFEYVYEDESAPAPESRPRQDQELRVSLDRKKRKGKEGTLGSGFAGPAEELRALAKSLKTRCSVGGTVKDGVIVLQGDHRDGVLALLKDAGYVRSKKSGG